MRKFLHLCLTSASVMILAASCFPKLLISEVAAPEASAPSESSSVSGISSSTVSSSSSSAATSSSAGSTSVSVETKNSRVSVVTDTSQRQLSYTLKFGKREMSGIIVAKPLADGSYRTLGTTIFGMTVFDMTVSKDSYTMNSCAEFLENKAFASFLAGKIRKALY